VAHWGPHRALATTFAFSTKILDNPCSKCNFGTIHGESRVVRLGVFSLTACSGAFAGEASPPNSDPGGSPRKLSSVGQPTTPEAISRPSACRGRYRCRQRRPMRLNMPPPCRVHRLPDRRRLRTTSGPASTWALARSPTGESWICPLPCAGRSSPAQDWPAPEGDGRYLSKRTRHSRRVQSREEPQYKPIRGGVVCCKSHTQRKLFEPTAHERRGPESSPS
jgi:hypothetical protein